MLLLALEMTRHRQRGQLRRRLLGEPAGPQLRVLQAERVAGVVERNQGEAGDRRAGGVAGHEAVQAGPRRGEFGRAGQPIQRGRPTRPRRRWPDPAPRPASTDSTIPTYPASGSLTANGATAGSRMMRVCRSPTARRGIRRQDVAAGEHLHDLDPGSLREALPDGGRRLGEFAVGRKERGGGVDGRRGGRPARGTPPAARPSRRRRPASTSHGARRMVRACHSNTARP